MVALGVRRKAEDGTTGPDSMPGAWLRLAFFACACLLEPQLAKPDHLPFSRRQSEVLHNRPLDGVSGTYGGFEHNRSSARRGSGREITACLA
mmetsp:Transcript_26401/g.48264  ORF Transcript_26401/g.48264 Transcript_26401/m.48264 type:complete len:92 (-) Transcript_26401:729-1004(-)